MSGGAHTREFVNFRVAGSVGKKVMCCAMRLVKLQLERLRDTMGGGWLGGGEAPKSRHGQSQQHENNIVRK
jgi:hypothetical protein